MTTPVEKNEAIVALERQMRAILDVSADGIITFDTLGFVVSSNLSSSWAWVSPRCSRQPFLLIESMLGS